jgi:ribosome-binding factor A
MSKMKLFIPDKASSHRQEKVAEEIRHVIADIFIRGDLPTLTDENFNPVSLKTPVTVTRVTVSPDLHHATAFIMPLGGMDKEFTLAYLAEVSPHVRHILSKKLALRIAPTVSFELDQSFDYADKINEALKKL